jgi:hypothetical protein
MAEILHLAEAWTRLSWPQMIPFCFHVKAAEVAAEVTSRAAVSTKMVAGRSILDHHRVTALQFLLFMFLCTYSIILDLGHVNVLARGTGDCARKIISGVDATISLGGCATRSIPGIAAVPHLTAGVRGSLPSQRDAAGDGKVSCEVSVATLTALARRSLNIEILRDPAKGKCISPVKRDIRKAHPIKQRIEHCNEYL